MTRKPCKFVDIKPDARGRVVMRKDFAYKCNYPAPELPLLPVSITAAYGFKWPPSRSSVWKDGCEDCPCWTPRETEGNRA